MRHVQLLLTVFSFSVLAACTVQQTVDQSIGSSAAMSSAQSSAATITFSREAKQMIGTGTTLRMVLHLPGHDGLTDIHVIEGTNDRVVTSYRERLPDDSMVYPYLLRSGLVYVPGPTGFGIHNLQGVDEMQTRRFLDGKDFSITSYLQLDDDHYLYGIHDADATQTKKGGLYWHEISTGNERFMPLSAVGLGKLEGVLPICVSTDRQFVYIEYQGWEGFTYNRLWKVRIADLSPTPLIRISDEIYSLQCHDASDRVLAVQTGQNPAMGMGGTPWAPSQLMLFDFAKNTLTVLESSTDRLISTAVITPDGTKVFFSELSLPPKLPDGTYPPEDTSTATMPSRLFMINTDGTGKRDLGAYGDLSGMSQDGSLIVAKGSGMYYLIRTSDGAAVRLEFVIDNSVISCGYSQGFDCLY